MLSRLWSAPLSFVIVACSATSDFAGGPPSTGGASSLQVKQCKESCDKMKFFDCSSADEQARCYGDCDKATPSQVEVFTGCAGSSICDPACRTNITPANQPKEGTGGSSSTCTTACEKLVTCSVIPLGKQGACVTECTSKGYQYQVDCVNKTACDKIPSTCGGGIQAGPESNVSNPPEIKTDGGGGTSFDIFECQAECDTLNFYECVSAAEHSACRAKCSSASATDRGTFTGCARSSGSDCTRLAACFDTFQK